MSGPTGVPDNGRLPLLSASRPVLGATGRVGCPARWDRLRCGDVHVPCSRRCADPASFLLTPQLSTPAKLEFCHLVGKPGERARSPTRWLEL